jgi:hypothetical protein
MFKKFFNRSPKNEATPPRDPNFKPNVTTIQKSGNFAHHSSSHSPFRNDNPSNSISIPSSSRNNISNIADKDAKVINDGRPMTQHSQHISANTLNNDKNLNLKDLKNMQDGKPSSQYSQKININNTHETKNVKLSLNLKKYKHFSLPLIIIYFIDFFLLCL